MPFLALHLRITPLERETVHDEHALYDTSLYNALLRLLDQTDPTEAGSSHPPGTSTHITVAPVKSVTNQQTARVTICGQHALSVTQTLFSTLAGQPVLYCGRQSYQVLSVDLAQATPTMVSTWADLLAPSSQLTLRLRFDSPAIFVGAVGESLPYECFPQPLQVFSTLLERWSGLGGPELGHELVPWLRDYGCFVSDYQLQAQPIDLRTEAGPVALYPGWKGWITYRCLRPHAAHMSALRSLARLACFTGVGAHTEVGLGITQIEENR